MLDHITFSVSHKPLAHTPRYSFAVGSNHHSEEITQLENSIHLTVSAQRTKPDQSPASDQEIPYSLLKPESMIQDDDRCSIADACTLTPLKASVAEISSQEREYTKTLFTSLWPQLKRWYNLRKPEETLRLLENYPLLNVYALEIQHHIDPYFTEAELFLEAVTDPDVWNDQEGSNDDLVVAVKKRIPFREAFEKLDRFYDSWWIKDSNRAQTRKRVCFSLEGSV